MYYFAGPVSFGPWLSLIIIVYFAFCVVLGLILFRVFVKNIVYFSKTGNKKKLILAIAMPLISIGLFLAYYLLGKASSDYYLQNFRTVTNQTQTPYYGYTVIVGILARISVLVAILVELIIFSGQKKNA